MKFEDDREVFKPFKIIVETEEEANFLCALVGGTNMHIDELFNFDSNDLYYYLLSKVRQEGRRKLFVRTTDDN